VDTLPKVSNLKRELWAKIFLLEKNEIVGKFYVRDWELQMDDSSDEYTGSV